MGEDEDSKANSNNDAFPVAIEGISMGSVSGRGDLRYARVAASNDDDHSSGEDIRSMPADELKSRLETILCDIVSRVGGDLKPPVDPEIPLISLGLDSMSIVQFKGVLDNRFVVISTLSSFYPSVIQLKFHCYDFLIYRYHCNIPDEFLFTNLATLSALVTAVKHG